MAASTLTAPRPGPKPDQCFPRARRAREERILDGAITKLARSERRSTCPTRKEPRKATAIAAGASTPFWKVVLWVVVIVLALAPYPWF